jgi:hypothetical protein
MPMNPKQLKAYMEKLARQRRAKEKAAKTEAGILPGMGDIHRVAPPTLNLGDDDWLHDQRTDGTAPSDSEKK